METELKILFVEDYLADAELAQQVLLKEGITFQSRVVENEVDFINELENFIPDIIISDFALPNFDALEVLKITLERKPEIPVLLLTGSIDEVTAVECIKNGAMDYIFKSHLSRLPFSIKEAIEKKKALEEKEKAEYELKKSEERYRELFENASIAIFQSTPDGKVIMVNPAFARMFGYESPEEVAVMVRDVSIDFFVDPQRRTEIIRLKAEHPELNGFENIYRRKDGSTFLGKLHVHSVIDSNGRTLYLEGFIEDITERKQAEERLYKLNRELRAISICNQALLKAVDEQTLLNEICRIICEEAGYRLAWVGYAEHDEAKTIRPIAWAGFDSGYIANAKLTWSEDSEHGKGPAGTAIRSGEAIYVQDFLTDPLMVPWRESAIQHGYRSGIAIPLKDEENKVFGLLLVYSAEVGAMKPEEIRLLAELASDLSFGIMTLRMRAKQKIAEESLRASEECFSTTFHFSPIAIAIYRPSDGSIVDVNDVFVETIGYPREEIIGHTTDELNLYADPEDRIRIGQVLRKQGSLENFEFGIRKKSGEIRIVLNSARLINIGGEKYYLSSIIDITERRKIEELLQITSRYTRSLIEASLDPLVTINPAGKITDVNEATEIVTGVLREELIGEDFTNYFTEPDKAKAGYQKVLAEGLVRDYPLTIQHSSGRTKDVLYNAVVFKNESGEIAGVFAAARDITERKRAEEILHESEERYRKAQAIGHVGSWEYNIKTTQFWGSDEAKRIYGFDVDADTFNTEEVENCIPERERVHQALIDLIEHDKEYNLEFDIITEDTKTRKTIISIANLERDKTGNPIKITGVIQDITERKLKEEKLRQSEEKFRTYIERAPVAVFVSDLDGHFLDCNPEITKLLGYEATALKQMSILNIYPAEERDKIQQALETLRQGGYAEGEFRLKRNDGTIIWVLLSISLVEGEIALGYCQNITERKLAAEKLKASEERFRRIAENARDVIYRMSLPDGKYEYVSPAALKVMGYKPEEFYESPLLVRQMIHPDWQKYFEEQWVNLIKGEMPHTYEYQIIHKSGEVRWINQRNILVRDDNGSPIAIEAIVSDITKRKNVEETLKESESVKELLLEKFDEAEHIAKVGSWEWDVQTNLVWWSNETYRIFGVTQKDYVPSFEENNKFIHPDDLILYNKSFEHSLQSGEPLDVELRLVSNDGLLKYCEAKGKVIFNDSGQPIRFMGTIMDITKQKRAKKALIKSEAKYRQFVETAIEAICETNKNEEITFANPRFSEMLGYTSGEIIGIKLTTFIFREDLDDYSSKLAMLHQGLNEIYERRFKRKDGTTLWTLISTSPIFDDNGNYNGSFRMLTDMMGIKRKEELLEGTNRLLRTVIDNLPDAIYAKDLNGCKILTNLADLKNIGAKNEEEILGKTDYDVFPEDIADKFFKDDQAVIQTGNSIINREEFFIKADGRKHWLLTSKLPLKDEKGKITGLVGIGRDVTKQKESEDKSKTLSKAVEQNPVSIVITNPDGIIEYVNPSFEILSGYSSAEIIGKNPRVLKSGYHTGEFYKNLWTTIKSGNDFRCEMKNRKKNGEFYWENAVLSPITNEHGNISHFVAVKEDITEKKKMVEELIATKEKAEEMSRLKSNFLANMSHELRTPLNGILGYADYLTSQLKDPELIETSQGIYDSGKRLSKTLNFILDLSEAATEHVERIVTDVDVIPLVKDTISSFAKEAQNRNLLFKTIIKEENIFAHIEERLFKRIVYNLLDNAFKFTKKGEITFEIGKKVISGKDWFYFKVADSGIGISKEKIDVVWDEFRQASEGLTRAYEGVGLGLTISKKAVELLHGVISVESELGVGSTFTVELPALSIIPGKEVELQAQRIVPQVQPSVIQHEKEKTETVALPLLLYIEDDFANRNVVKYFLKNICTIETVGDGETALPLINEKKYDVLLVDINLGEGMNGLTLVEEVLKIPRYANTPIIAVTAFAMENDKTEFLKRGFTDYISKPFFKDEIINLVKSAIENRQ